MTVGHEPPLSRRQMRKNARDAAAANASSSDGLPSEATRSEVAPSDGASSGATRSNPEYVDAVLSDAGQRAGEPGSPIDAAAPGFRVRDFRPEGRRSSSTAGSNTDQADADAEWTPPDASAAPQQERTYSEVPVDAEIVADPPMTRRQLRALREQEEAAGRPAPHVVFPPTGSIPIADVSGVIEERIEPAATDRSAVNDRPATTGDAKPDYALPSDQDEMFDEFAIATAIEEPDAEVFDAEVVEDAVTSATPPATGHDAASGNDADPGNDTGPGDNAGSRNAGADPDGHDRGPDSFDAEFGSDLDAGGGPGHDTGSGDDTDIGHLTQIDASGPVTSTIIPALEEPHPASVDVDSSRGIEPAPTTTGPVFGHWSDQDHSDDADLDHPMLSRDVGLTTGAITTHALVLPSIPQSGDQLLTPLSTGEIMLTGSIDLPRSFGSTGAHPALFDHSDVDALIDEADRDDASAESAPVRAIRAVSSNTSSRGVIEAPAPTKSRLPMIAAITGGSVVLLGIGAVAAGFILNLF